MGEGSEALLADVDTAIAAAEERTSQIREAHPHLAAWSGNAEDYRLTRYDAFFFSHYILTLGLQDCKQGCGLHSCGLLCFAVFFLLK